MKYIDYLFEVIDEESDLYGERFFIEVLDNEDALDEAWEIATETFPYEEIEYIGTYTPSQAEAMGYDTY